jgi:hypothetical protein
MLLLVVSLLAEAEDLNEPPLEDEFDGENGSACCW